MAPKESTMPPTAWEFQNRLMAILNSARKGGKPYIDVDAGRLHKQVAGYLNSRHRLPVCCEVMKRMMRAGDLVLKESESKQGRKLLIRYNV
jgi:hypothetical protein